MAVAFALQQVFVALLASGHHLELSLQKGDRLSFCPFRFWGRWAALLMTPIYCFTRQWVLIRPTLSQPCLIWIYLHL